MQQRLIKTADWVLLTTLPSYPTLSQHELLKFCLKSSLTATGAEKYFVFSSQGSKLCVFTWIAS